MKQAARALVLCLLLSGIGASLAADPVEYVKVCSAYGAGFFYVPGTDTCTNAANGDTRVETANGTWRSRTPYPAGRWEKDGRLDCPGRLVRLGTFASSDFSINAWDRKQTAPIALPVTDKEYVTEVWMSGGFYDPRLAGQRSGAPVSQTAFCVRSLDPSIPEVSPEPNPEDPPSKPRWGNGMLPIACVHNSRLLNMPATYVVSADSSYPSVERGFWDEEQSQQFGPWVYNTHVAVTTDMGNGSANLLTYFDAADGEEGTHKPLAGSVTVSVCVAKSLATPAR